MSCRCPEDVVDFVEDGSGELPGGLMTAPLNEQSATQENHCATESEVCLLPGKLGHRLTGDNCSGGDKAWERPLNRQRGSNYVDRDCSERTSANKHFRGHAFFVLLFGVWASVAVSFEGSACFCAVCPSQLSVYTNEHSEHLCSDARLFVICP